MGLSNITRLIRQALVGLSVCLWLSIQIPIASAQSSANGIAQCALSPSCASAMGIPAALTQPGTYAPVGALGLGLAGYKANELSPDALKALRRRAAELFPTWPTKQYYGLV